MIGFVFWQEQEGKFDVALEDLFLETVENALDAFEEDDSGASDDINTLIQACCSLSHYYLFRNSIQPAENWLRRAVEAIGRLDLRMTVDAVRDAFLDDASLGSTIFQEARSIPEERVAVLGQILFLDNTISLLKESNPLLPDKYEAALFSLRVRFDSRCSLSCCVLMGEI